MNGLPEILYEDNHCLAVNKPSGALTTHFEGKDETVDRAVKRYLKAKYQKPGNVFLGVVHRLDKPVSGVLLFARTGKAASRLAAQFREGSVEKTYWAIVEGAVGPDHGRLEDWLGQSPEGRVAIVNPETAGARHAVLEFVVRDRCKGLSWLELKPLTGRKNQLRVQLAQQGHPIFGDLKFGSDRSWSKSIALHARSLKCGHPIRKDPITITARLPKVWIERFGPLFPRLLDE